MNRNTLLKEWRMFTLIELLLVVSILMILMSVLLPALRNARNKAYAIKCQNQMKQLHLTVMYYIDDNKGLFPPCLDATAGVYWWKDDILGGESYLKLDYSIPDNMVHCCVNPFRWSSNVYLNYVMYQNVSQLLFKIKHPGDSVYFLEAGMNSRYQFWGNSSPTYGWSVVMGLPHGGLGNALFIDGHVQATKQSELETDKNFSPND